MNERVQAAISRDRTVEQIVVVMRGDSDPMYFHHRGATLWGWVVGESGTPLLRIWDEDEGTHAEFPADAVAAVYHAGLECPCPCVKDNGIQHGHSATRELEESMHSKRDAD